MEEELKHLLNEDDTGMWNEMPSFLWSPAAHSANLWSTGCKAGQQADDVVANIAAEAANVHCIVSNGQSTELPRMCEAFAHRVETRAVLL